MNANTDRGYILLSRSLIDSPIMKKPPEFLKVWIYLLAKASHKDTGNLKRGEGFTSLAELAEVLSHFVGYRKVVPSKKKIWGIIEYLRRPCEGNDEGNTDDAMIVTTKVTHGIVYKVCKYDVYQSPELYEGNSEGNSTKITKVERRERQGNNINKNEQEEEEYILSKSNVEKFFEDAWSRLPRKEGKGAVSLKKKKELCKLGDEFLRCIDRFNTAMAGREKQYIPMGSTFCNTRYIDYLDSNYVDRTDESEMKERQIRLDEPQRVPEGLFGNEN